MKGMGGCVIVVFALCFAASPAGAVIVFDDGGAHEISTDLGQHISIYDGPGSLPTTVRLLTGGAVRDVDVYQNSRFIMLGGRSDGLYLHDYSESEVSGGNIDEDPFYITDFAQLTITGGYVEESLRCYRNSQVFIHGCDFTIDDEPAGYGPITAATGFLRGELLNGGQIGCGFSINDNAAITLVPEPASIVLLGLGGLLLLRKRKGQHTEKLL